HAVAKVVDRVEREVEEQAAVDRRAQAGLEHEALDRVSLDRGTVTGAETLERELVERGVDAPDVDEQPRREPLREVPLVGERAERGDAVAELGEVVAAQVGRPTKRGELGVRNVVAAAGDALAMKMADQD